MIGGGLLFVWLLAMLPAWAINGLLSEEYGWPGVLTFIARIALWPIFLLKLIVLVLLAGWRDLWR